MKIKLTKLDKSVHFFDGDLNKSIYDNVMAIFKSKDIKACLVDIIIGDKRWSISQSSAHIDLPLLGLEDSLIEMKEEEDLRYWSNGYKYKK